MHKTISMYNQNSIQESRSKERPVSRAEGGDSLVWVAAVAGRGRRAGRLLWTPGVAALLLGLGRVRHRRHQVLQKVEPPLRLNTLLTGDAGAGFQHLFTELLTEVTGSVNQIPGRREKVYYKTTR